MDASHKLDRFLINVLGGCDLVHETRFTLSVLETLVCFKLFYVAQNVMKDFLGWLVWITLYLRTHGTYVTTGKIQTGSKSWFWIQIDFKHGHYSKTNTCTDFYVFIFQVCVLYLISVPISYFFLLWQFQAGGRPIHSTDCFLTYNVP